MNRLLALFALGLLFPYLVYSECPTKQDFRSDKKGGILIDDFVITGTRAVDSAELSAIVGRFAGSCFNDNSGEISGRLKDQFQQRGYFMAKIGNIHIKASDPLARPKPVTIEAEVQEGPRYTISELRIEGNHTIDAQRIAAQYPLKLGATFSTSNVRTGMEALRRLYGSEGYPDFVAVPDTKLQADAKVILTIPIDEGKQYRMGRLEVKGERESTRQIDRRR